MRRSQVGDLKGNRRPVGCSQRSVRPASVIAVVVAIHHQRDLHCLSYIERKRLIVREHHDAATKKTEIIVLNGPVELGYCRNKIVVGVRNRILVGNEFYRCDQLLRLIKYPVVGGQNLKSIFLV